MQQPLGEIIANRDGPNTPTRDAALPMMAT